MAKQKKSVQPVQRTQPTQKGPATSQASPAPAPTKKYTDITIMSVMLGIVAFLIYSNTFGLDYALDDFTVIKNNSIVTKGLSAIPEILATPYRRGWFITNNDLYRPLSLVMFAAEWQFGNGSPAAGHFMNVIVYLAGVVLLFRFLDKLLGRDKIAIAFIAALIFAVHPIHTEVVANIKSRDELLCFMFAFLSLNYFLTYMTVGKMQQLLLAGGCLFLSFMSKETVISFLFVVPFLLFFYKNTDNKRAIAGSVVTVIVTAVFLAIRFMVLRKYDANTSSEVSFIDNFLTKAPSAGAAFATEVFILGKYLFMLVVPAPLVCDYCYNSIPFKTFGDIGVIISLMAYLAMAGYGIFRFIKKRNDLYAFAILYFLATIALFSNIPFIIGAAMAERFVFFASAGFCLAIALLIQQFVLRKEVTSFADVRSGATGGILLVVALLFGYMSYARNNDWADNYTLFKADVPKNENNARLNYYLGTEMVATKAKQSADPAERRKYTLEAIPYLHRSLAIYPEYTDANASLGDAFFQLGVYDSAEIYDKRALELNPKFTVAINNIAGVYFMQNKFDKALEVCKKAIEINPGYVNAYSNIGLCYMRLGKFDSSLANLYKAISIDPRFKGAYENMALTYKVMGKVDSANKYEALSRSLN